MKVLTRNRALIMMSALSLMLFVFSCKKENNPQQTRITVEDAVTYSSESMEADASYDDIQDIAMTAADDEALESAGRTGDAGRDPIRVFVFAHLRLRIGPCADITVSPNDNTYPKTITIDFGNGCSGLDGKWRRGSIVLHFTGPVRQPGSVVTVTLVDFKLNRVSVEGTKVITNLSENGEIKFSVQVTGGKVTFPNGRGYAFEKLKYVKQVAGSTTDELKDDVYSISGRAETKFNNGVTVVLNTMDDLIKKFNCAWISEGKLKITINNLELQLDYGFPNNGECDNKALLIWSGGNRVLVLP